MQAYAVSYSKYLITASIVLYTVLSYIALPAGETSRRTIEVMQKLCMAIFMVNAFVTMSVLSGSPVRLVFGAAVLVVLLAAGFIYQRLYRGANMLMFGNVMMLLGIGIVMISRINESKAYKQAVIAAAGIIFVLAFPKVRNHLDRLRRVTYFYAIAGIAALAGVLALGAITNGSKLSYTLAGFTFQPSEFVKILFILFMAGALCEAPTRGHILLLTATAVAHVGILLLSRDLGSALIFYVVYISMLYLATGKYRYLLTGIILGVIGAIVCYLLFAHVRVRVQVFLDPWSTIDGSGYQITQSLFAISFGGLFGAGLMQGMPSSIPFVESDFIFSAIAEEMGIVTGVCVMLLCLNIFIDFMMLARSYTNEFYRLYTFGTGVAFIFQAFMTIGGEVKFIPLTGVTLPLVSYGGSSVLATLMMFGVVGAIFILQTERLERFKARYEEEFGPGNRTVQGQMPYGQTLQGQAYQGQRPYGQPPQDRNENSDFYKDFKGVPIYDPGRDYENMNHFDI